MSVKLPTEQHLEYLSLKGDCTGSSESTLGQMPHCWKSYVVAQTCFMVCLHFMNFCFSAAHCLVLFTRDVKHSICSLLKDIRFAHMSSAV